MEINRKVIIECSDTIKYKAKYIPMLHNNYTYSNTYTFSDMLTYRTLLEYHYNNIKLYFIEPSMFNLLV